MPTRESVDLRTRERLRRHLRALLDEHRMKPADLARRLDVSRGTISAILSGDRTMGLDVFIKLHREFGVSANYLLDSDDQNSKPKGKP